MDHTCMAYFYFIYIFYSVYSIFPKPKPTDSDQEEDNTTQTTTSTVVNFLPVYSALKDPSMHFLLLLRVQYQVTAAYPC